MKYKNRFDNKLKNNEMVNFEDYYLWTIEEKAKAYDELIEYLKKEIEILENIPKDEEMTIEAHGRLNAYRIILYKLEKSDK